MPEARILVVDDEPDIRQLVREILEDEGYRVSVAQDGESARAAFTAECPDLVLLDIWMPDVDGISLLKEWSESGRLECPVVMISGHGTLETAVEATRLGARDFVQKPLSLAKLLATVRNALSSRPEPMRSAATGASGPVEPVGTSPQMQLLRQKAELAAQHAAPILITGETGCGQDVLAAWLHRRSNRSGPLLVLDAGRLGGPDARAYLLGRQDTEAPSHGVFDTAADGTLFVPDLAALAEDAQALLCAVLEAGEYTPLGGSEARAVTARLIVAGPPDTERLAREGAVLDRLFLQLNVLALQVPPLRERPEDVPELVRHYTDWLSNSEGLAYRQFSISALNRLRNHQWPGNELELRNLVQRLLTLGGDAEVTVGEVDEALRHAALETPMAAGRHGVFDLPLREAREQFEREYLIYQLKKAGGSVGRLSEAVGMERTHLYRKLRSLGIDPKSVTARGNA